MQRDKAYPSFRDPTAQQIQKELIADLCGGRAGTIRKSAEHLRFSANRKDRLHSAIAYSVLAVGSVAKQDYRQATYLFHYAGQAFRSIGMTSWAAKMYVRSAEEGEKAESAIYNSDDVDAAYALQKFNLRSLGRAANCFVESGQHDQAIAAKRSYHNAELLECLRRGRQISALALTTWRFALDYSLSWTRAFLWFCGGAALIFPASLEIALPILLASTGGVISVCCRRLF